MPRFRWRSKLPGDAAKEGEKVSPYVESPSLSAPVILTSEDEDEDLVAKQHLAKLYAEDLRDTLRKNLDLELNKRASLLVRPEDVATAKTQLTPTPKVNPGGDLFVTIHGLSDLPKKLHMIHRKVFHCIVTCGTQCKSTQVRHTEDNDLVKFEEVLSFQYDNQPILVVEIYDSKSRFHPFQCLGRAEFILSQALLRGAGWRGSRELMDPKTEGKCRGVIALSLLYSNHL